MLLFLIMKSKKISQILIRKELYLNEDKREFIIS